MIQVGTVLKVADNSGARLVRCIKVLGGSNYNITGVSNVVVLSVISVSPSSTKAKKGSVVKGVIVRTRSSITRPDGSFIRFDDNAVVLVGSDGEPIASRVFGPIAREVKSKGFLKISSLASELV